MRKQHVYVVTNILIFREIRFRFLKVNNVVIKHFVWKSCITFQYHFFSVLYLIEIFLIILNIFDFKIHLRQ